MRIRAIRGRAGVMGLLLVAGLTSGCIAIVDRGTRNGKVTRFASEVIRKGDKKVDVKARLGEPDGTYERVRPFEELDHPTSTPDRGWRLHRVPR
jgi:hypothetical protein